MPAARIGTACTETKPASSAAGTNRGHRAVSSFRSATDTGWPVDVALHAGSLVGLQLEELQLAGLLGGGGQQAQLVEWVGEQKAGGGDVEQLGTTFGEFGQQVHDVEVLEKGVDEGDDRVQNAGFTRDCGHFRLRPWMRHQSASSLSLRSRMSRATSVALRPVE